jgi:hypothetical protein
MNALHDHPCIAMAQLRNELLFRSIELSTLADSFKLLEAVGYLANTASIPMDCLKQIAAAVTAIEAQQSIIDTATDLLFESLEKADGPVTIQRLGQQVPTVCTRPFFTHDQQLQAGDAGAMVTGQVSPPGGT